MVLFYILDDNEASKNVYSSFDDFAFSFFFQFHGPNTEKNPGPAPFYPHRPAQEEKNIDDVFLFQGLAQNITNECPFPVTAL